MTNNNNNKGRKKTSSKASVAERTISDIKKEMKDLPLYECRGCGTKFDKAEEYNDHTKSCVCGVAKEPAPGFISYDEISPISMQIRRQEKRLALLKARKAAGLKERVVNVIGMGKSARRMPEDGEMWGINYAFMYGKMDKIFFCDKWNEYLRDSNHPRVRESLESALRDETIEFVSLHAIQVKDPKTDKILPNIKTLPLEAATELAPGLYFTSTMAWIMAYAILEGEINDHYPVERIRMYGFEVWSGCNRNEYYWEKPCLDYWIAYANGRGIAVDIPHYIIHTVGTHGFRQSNIYGVQDPVYPGKS